MIKGASVYIVTTVCQYLKTKVALNWWYYYDISQYINKKSNHPPNFIKHPPASIEKRLSDNSFDEKIFKESAIYYEDTLNNAGYINKLVYHTPSANTRKTKTKIGSGTLYGLTHHIIKMSQRE